MNTPIKKYIRTISKYGALSMDRPTLTRVSEYNKYSRFKLTYSKTAKELESNLLVGKKRTETVCFQRIHQFYCF
jgi:hypothetical protein